MPGQYMALPPDINAARIEGPGEASILASGVAMNALGAAVTAAAATVTSSVATLAAAGWTGPTGVSTAASFAPNIGWMAEQAVKCEAIGAKQITFAQAYRTANLMIPKVPVVAENQTEHGVLQATNFLGINTASIAANRATYQSYWTAAGVAMNSFETVGTVQAAPIPAEPPPPITSMGVGMLAAGVSTGVSAGVGVAQAAMSAATGGLGAMTGMGTAAASALGPAAAKAAGTTGAGSPAGSPGAGKAAGTPGGTEAQQLTSLLGQSPQALSQLPQALGSAPSAATQAFSGPGQAVMGPLQSLMSAGGSGLGAPTTGVNGVGGMYPGSMGGAVEAGSRSAANSAGLTRSAGIGGGGGFAMPSGWRSTADTLGIGAAPAAGLGSGRPVGGGADLRGMAGGGGMSPMMAPMSPSAGYGRGTRAHAALSVEEDPFGADEIGDLPMTLTSGDRGT